MPGLEVPAIVTLPGTVEDLWQAIELLLSEDVIAAIGNLETYRHDIIDISYNILFNIFNFEATKYQTAYNQKNLASLKAHADFMKNLHLEVDKLLSSDKFLLLGKWIEDAKNQVTSPADKALFEFNARNLLTLWGPEGNINDYARKGWGSFYTSYYSKRWTLFFDTVYTAVQSGSSYNKTEFDANCLVYEKSWQPLSEVYPSTATGDSLVLVKEFYAKYRNYS
jgi:alpha-N-acetylglucosaminidase